MKNNKCSQIKSTSTTNQSCKETQQHISAYGGAVGKKFMRKRQGSNQSYRRNNGSGTPKSSNSSFTDRSDSEREDSRTQDSILSMILKGNSFIKSVQSPISTKMSESMGSVLLQYEKQNQKTKNDFSYEKMQNISKFQQSFQTPKTHIHKGTDKIFQNCRLLNTNSSKRISKLQMQNISQSVYKSSIYDGAQTDRQLYKCLEKMDIASQMKVIENQIIILEDENSRLKKQVIELTIEKQKEEKLRIKAETLVGELQAKIAQMKEDESSLMRRIKKQLNEIYWQVSKGLKINSLTKMNQQNQSIFLIKSHLQNPISKSNPRLKISRKDDGFDQKLDIMNFSENFLQPAFQIIKQSLFDYSKALENSRVYIQKLQIKQSIMMRSSQQLEHSRSKNKLLTHQLQQQKIKIKRIKLQCDHLKKQNNMIKTTMLQIRNRSRTKSQKTLDHNFNKVKQTNEDNFSLCFSDVSDQEFIFNNNNDGNRMKKNIK